MNPEKTRPLRADLAKFYGDHQDTDNPNPKGGPGGTETSKSRRQPLEDDGPLNINSPNFNADLFTQTLIKEASLSQLTSQNNEIQKQIGSLDSEMQTLVYENYNKFIAATDTIKKMRVDFRAMEDEMDQLATKMQNITMFSGQITDTLKDRRVRIGQLSGTHALLKKLQFLFELPTRLNECITQDNLAQGVKYYLRAQRVLDQYQHMNSFKGIKKDCDDIMEKLRQKLLDRLQDTDTKPEDLSLCVELAVQLQESDVHLCDLYIRTCRCKLEESFLVLEFQLKLASGEDVDAIHERPSDAFQAPMDILEFVDHGCNTYISDICLIIANYNETFLNRDSPDRSNLINADMAKHKLIEFVSSQNKKFFDLLKSRLKLNRELDDSALRARALDRFYRRIQAMTRLLSGIDFARNALDLVLEASEMQCQLALEELKKELQEGIMNVRQSLVVPRRVAHLAEVENELNLAKLNTDLLTLIGDKIRHKITFLELFIDPEMTFAVKSYFRGTFCRHHVREQVLVGFFSHIIDIAQNFCVDSEKNSPPTLLLLLSRTCYDLQINTTQHLVSMVEDHFRIDDTNGLTTVNKINSAFKEVSQILLNDYVKCQGYVLSQMLRKSVETRDWLNSVEPRTPRAVMKRIVEETTTIDRQVGKLYEDGARKARSSDSSRRTRYSHAQAKSRSGWSMSNTQLNTSLASNIQKMFNEKIEIFAPVEFAKVSILTGILKIALKTLLECVRLRTFSKFGFQQIQVDTHYLNLYLWQFVSDENLVIFLLDEIMTSAVHRCPNPVPMEGSIIDMICDRG